MKIHTQMKIWLSSPELEGETSDYLDTATRICWAKGGGTDAGYFCCQSCSHEVKSRQWEESENPVLQPQSATIFFSLRFSPVMYFRRKQNTEGKKSDYTFHYPLLFPLLPCSSPPLTYQWSLVQPPRKYSVILFLLDLVEFSSAAVLKI